MNAACNFSEVPACQHRSFYQHRHSTIELHCNLVIMLMMGANLTKERNNEIGSWWRLSRLMPAITDERCANANIFASTGNTVRVRRHLQRIDMQS